jgi:hypothetical protein
MKQHVTIVGALYIGLGVLGLLTALIVFMGTGGAGLIVLAAEGGGEAVPILWTIACGVSSFLALLALPGIIGGIGVLKYKRWARYLVLILGVLNLFNVPVGTIIGVYTLWVLLQDETAELFDSDSLALTVPEF